LAGANFRSFTKLLDLIRKFSTLHGVKRPHGGVISPLYGEP